MSKYIWLAKQFVLQPKIKYQMEMLYLLMDSEYIKYLILKLLIYTII